MTAPVTVGQAVTVNRPGMGWQRGAITDIGPLDISIKCDTDGATIYRRIKGEGVFWRRVRQEVA